MKFQTSIFLISSFLLFSWDNQAQIIAGSPAPGIRVDTPNIVQYIPTNSSDLRHLFLNCDTVNNVNLFGGSGSYPTGAGMAWVSDSYFFVLDTTIEMGKGFFPTIPSGQGPPQVYGAQRIDAGVLIDGSLNVDWFFEDSVVLNKSKISPIVVEYWSCDFDMKYIPIRKKYGSEYLYGWILASANSPSFSANLLNRIHQITKFPQLHVIYDTLNCGSSYTFSDGFTVNSILHDTVYDFVIPSTISGCDSLVRTKLHVPPSYQTNIFDTICSGLQYVFPDGDSVNNLTKDSIHYNIFPNVNGCDSIIVSNVHVLHDTTFETVTVCYASLFTFPDGQTFTMYSNNSHNSMFVNANGCDSIIKTNVFVIPKDTTIKIAVCDQYYFNGQLRKTSGIYFDTLTNILGCDSLIKLKLSISSAKITSVIATPAYICDSGNTTIVANVNNIVNYCIPVATWSIFYNISNFTFNTTSINHSTSSDTTSYHYFSSFNANVTAGASYPFSINGNTEGRAMWVDFNQDEDFDDPGELVYTNYNASSYYSVPFTGNITIPLNALDGKTRIRIGCYTTSNMIDPCGNTEYGEFEDYNMTISGGVHTVNWSPGTFLGTTYGNKVEAINVNANTTYTVTVTSGFGCSTTSSIKINVHESSAGSQNITICSNQIPFTWNGHSMTTSGIYNFVTLNNAGCDSNIVLGFNINPIPSPKIVQSENSLSTLFSYISYQWYENEIPILGATAQHFSPEHNGNYTVRVTDSNGCIAGSQKYIYVQNENSNSCHCEVIPNPFADKILVVNNLNFQLATIKLYSSTGALLLEKYNVRGHQVEFDLSSISSGLYFIEITDDQAHCALKIVKGDR